MESQGWRDAVLGGQQAAVSYLERLRAECGALVEAGARKNTTGSMAYPKPRHYSDANFTSPYSRDRVA